MAKKKKSKTNFASGLKNAAIQYKNKAFSMVMDFVEKEAVNIVSWLKDMIKLKHLIRKLIVSTVLILAATIVLVMGIANYIAELSGVSPGLMQIIVGVVLVVIAKIYSSA